MNSDELFDHSKKTKNEPIGNSPLETRAYTAAFRGGFVPYLGDPVDIDKLRGAIEDGSVWDVRNAGNAIIKIWCEWVTGERMPPR